jgi:integrase
MLPFISVSLQASRQNLSKSLNLAATSSERGEKAYRRPRPGVVDQPRGPGGNLQEQILSLLEAITDLHDLCLLYIGIFCGPRSSEVFGSQWAFWNGDPLLPLGTAYEGKLYVGRTKTKQSKAPISVPDQVRPVIEAWKAICPDTSPEALMFPTFGRGKRKGEAVPRWGKNFLKWRIRPETGHYQTVLSPSR